MEIVKLAVIRIRVFNLEKCKQCFQSTGFRFYKHVATNWRPVGFLFSEKMTSPENLHMSFLAFVTFGRFGGLRGVLGAVFLSWERRRYQSVPQAPSLVIYIHYIHVHIYIHE
jgi:hypothetical protein